MDQRERIEISLSIEQLGWLTRFGITRPEVFAFEGQGTKTPTREQIDEWMEWKKKELEIIEFGISDFPSLLQDLLEHEKTHPLWDRRECAAACLGERWKEDNDPTGNSVWLELVIDSFDRWDLPFKN